jgi:AcrR family transcriptional regulator
MGAFCSEQDELQRMSGKNPNSPVIDRRVARTRRLLHQALMQLIRRKPYDRITIQDLLDEADVGRSTFYAHYVGKDELLRRGFEELRAELEADQEHSNAVANEPALAFSLAMFAHADRYKEIYRALVGSSGNAIVLAEIRRVLVDMSKKELDELAHNDLPGDLIGRFVVDVFQSVLTWWLERRPELTPAAVDAMFRRLVIPAITGRSG